VTIQWSKLAGYRPEPEGLYATTGEVFRFKSLRVAGKSDSRVIPFEFTTEVLKERAFGFTGEFHNSHVYEDEVADPNEVVASGKLRTYAGGKLERQLQVGFTYSGKLRTSLSDVNVPYPSGTTDLMIAARKGDLAKVRELLARGANVNAKARAGRTALTWALDDSVPSTDMIASLIAAGADANLVDGDGSRPLTVAVYRRSSRVVELLIAAGANVNARTSRRTTPLIDTVSAVASGTGAIENVRVLLRAGADVNAKDSFGRTALSIARAAHDDETVAILLQAGAKQ
jgi:ankyrin repeat protein